MAEAFWDKRSKTYDHDLGKPNPARDQRLARTKALLGPSDVVLDLGCATGEESIALATQVSWVQGIDLSPEMIRLARQKAKDRGVEDARFDQMEAFDHRLDLGSFTAVIAFNILHLVEDPAKVLARLHELLGRRGVVIAQIPCLGDWGWIMRSLLGLAQKFGWAPAIHHFTVSEVEALVTDAKFEIIESKNYNGNNVVQWIVARKIS